MKKKTDELGFELKQNATTPDEYLKDNADELITESITAYIAKLMQQKNLDKASVIHAAGLDRIYGYQLLSGKRGINRDRLLQLAFGMKLTLEETQKLLKTARMAVLYERDVRDVFIISALYNGYDIDSCDQLLFDHQQPTLQNIS
ncbi:MAG: XRE family transcriptional regulator [Eubacteriales bacterium]|nr:XRE family transcriptional regulator [Eubacteriales bacterium]